MAYGSDIDALGFQHRWAFDGDLLDAVGSVNGTNSGAILTRPAICEDATNCMTTNGVSDRVTIPNTADINNSAQTRKIICGWFAFTEINLPYTRIWGEGNATTCFQMVAGFGNNIIYEVQQSGSNVQIYSDRPLVPNRPYHLTLVFEGTGFGNIVKGYLDGVLQTESLPADGQPDVVSLPARTPVELGDPVGTVGLDGTSLLIVAPVSGDYNQWASGDGFSLTDSQVRVELFEKGATPKVTVSSDTEANMQTAFDALDTSGNHPLVVRIEAVTGDGDLTINSNKVFDDLASCHIRYLGTGTLTIVNTGSGNASIVSGNVVVENPATLTLNFTQSGSEVRIYEDDGVDVNDFGTELDGIESTAGTTFAYSHAGSTNDIVIQIIKDGYREIIFRLQIGASDQTLNFTQQIDTNQ